MPTPLRGDVLLLVRRTFITPFDRSDIKDLINTLDDTIDQMQKTAKAVLLFEVTQLEPQMAWMGDRIVRAAKLTVEAVGLLNALRENATRLNGITEEMVQLEDDADTLNDSGYQIAVRAAPQRQRDGLLHRRRDLRPSRKGHGPFRGRGEPHQWHRDRAGLTRAPILVSLIAIALFFDFLNGRNDAANSIATIVSTRVLAPRYAVAWAAFFNFVGVPCFRIACRKHRRPRHHFAASDLG